MLCLRTICCKSTLCHRRCIFSSFAGNIRRILFHNSRRLLSKVRRWRDCLSALIACNNQHCGILKNSCELTCLLNISATRSCSSFTLRRSICDCLAEILPCGVPNRLLPPSTEVRSCRTLPATESTSVFTNFFCTESIVLAIRSTCSGRSKSVSGTVYGLNRRPWHPLVLKRPYDWMNE